MDVLYFIELSRFYKMCNECLVCDLHWNEVKVNILFSWSVLHKIWKKFLRENKRERFRRAGGKMFCGKQEGEIYAGWREKCNTVFC